jgi:5-methylcytosine-specific restriction endonuclease McrA
MSRLDDRSSKAMKRIRRRLKAQRQPCWLCGQPINYESTDPTDPDSFTLDHVVPWSVSRSLRLDPGNAKAAHRRCNLQRGSDAPKPGLGLLSREI